MAPLDLHSSAMLLLLFVAPLAAQTQRSTAWMLLKHWASKGLHILSPRSCAAKGVSIWKQIHTSRPLSAPVANRPLSPHLPLKKPQLSATFSISHRIFGVALGAAIISVPLATKFSLMFDV